MFNKLPDELVLEVLSFLLKAQISRLAPTNKTFTRCGEQLVPDFSKTIRLDTLVTLGCREYRDLKLFCTSDKKGKIFLVWQYKWGIFKKNYLECVMFDMASQRNKRVTKCIYNEEISCQDKISYSKKNELILNLARYQKGVLPIRREAIWNINYNKIFTRDSVSTSPKCKEKKPHYKFNTTYLPNGEELRIDLHEKTSESRMQYKGRFVIHNEDLINNYVVNSDHIFILTETEEIKKSSTFFWRGFRNLDFKNEIYKYEFKIKGTYMFHCFFPQQGCLLMVSRKNNNTVCLALYSFPVIIEKSPYQPCKIQTMHE